MDQKGRRKSVKAGFWRVDAMQWIFILSSMERWVVLFTNPKFSKWAFKEVAREVLE